MQFADPDALWWLLLLPPLGLAAWLAAWRRRRALERFAGGRDRADRFDGQVGRHRRAIKALLLGTAAAAGIVALARPQWGTRLEPIQRRGLDVVVVLDTSLSMAAEDVAPSRLVQAGHQISTLLDRLAGNRVGLVTFAGQAVLTCPLTPDLGAVRLFLDTLDVESAPLPGTALASAVELALRALGDEPADAGARTIVLFSDGEDHAGGIDRAIAELRRRGVTLYAVGCGTSRGSPIPLRAPGGLLSGYKKDGEGKIVTTRLSEDNLRRLALETGGRYFRATPTEGEIEEIAAELAGMDSREFGATLRPRYEERFQIPLALALLALLGESLIGDRRRPATGAGGTR